MTKRMQSSYPNTKCCVCLEPIQQGEDIEWTKGEGSRHIACIGQPAMQVKPERLARAVAFLTAKCADGKGGRFMTDVLDGYRKRGKLSIAQIEAVLSIADRPPLAGPDVLPAGNYCLPVLNLPSKGNDLMFVKIKRWGEDGASAYLILGPREDRKLPAGKTIDRIIEFGVAESAKLYGAEIGRCCICNSQLTNRLSRHLHIGPVCGGRVHDEDDWYVMRKQGKADLLADGLDPDDELPPIDFDWSKAAGDDDLLDRPLGKVEVDKPKTKARRAKKARTRAVIAAEMAQAIQNGTDYSHLLTELEAL